MDWYLEPGLLAVRRVLRDLQEHDLVPDSVLDVAVEIKSASSNDTQEKATAPVFTGSLHPYELEQIGRHREPWNRIQRSTVLPLCETLDGARFASRPPFRYHADILPVCRRDCKGKPVGNCCTTKGSQSRAIFIPKI